MYIKVVTFLLTTIFLLSCSSDTPQIRAVCDNDPAESYTLKWEVVPARSGNVQIYESKDPESFSDALLIGEKPISEGYSIIPRKDNVRRFFRLVFDKKYTSVVGERHIITERIDNLRDLGGYYKGKTRQVKWGKLFRSGTVSWLSPNDKIILDSLHIHTLLDLRNQNIIKQYPCLYKAPVIKNIGLHSLTADSIRNKIFSKQMKKGDVLISLQDMYAQIIELDIAELKNIFDILLDEKNYPVLFHCAIGKDRTGLVSILILEALGIDREQILHDYMLSNQYINFNRAVVQAPDLPEEAQEALTTLMSANETVFNYIYQKIEADYGSIDNYLEKKLDLTSKKREKLQEILLY